MRQIAFVIVVVILSAGITGIIFPVSGLPIPGDYSSPIGVINISTVIPDSPSTIIAYRVVPGPNDMVYYSTADLEKVRSSVPSEADAPQIAQNILNKYGGLPQDAVLTLSSTEYLIQMNGTTNQEINRYPVSTNVQFGRKINGVPVVGDGAYINMELGENGELLYLNKAWKTVIPDGNLPIQPVSVAIAKLRTGEVLNPKKDSHDVDITKIRLGYFEKGMNQSEDFLEPAWLFKGTTESGDPIQYYVYARQFANFTATPSIASMSDTITFTDTSDASPTKWLWDFGDGKNSSVQNPVHQYLSTGTYSVSLTATNPDGASTKTRANYITVTAISHPEANFTGQPTYGKSPLRVTFNDTSAGTPTQWYWTFGDDTNSTVQDPVHTYLSNGKYTVALIASNSGGSSTKTRTDYIVVSCSANPPSAKFVATPTSGTAPLNVRFNDTSIGSPTSWYWNFGDGSNSMVRNPIHVYTSAGKYTVSLTATNSFGSDTRTERDYITVKSIKPPCADFSGKPTSGKGPLSVMFNDTSEGSPTGWTWDFGDNTNSTLQNPAHTYVTAGKYTVSMTSSNAGGSNTKTREQYITVTTPTPTPTTLPLYAAPILNVSAKNCNILLNWNIIMDPRLQGYKVVISKSNPNPKYPDDGYMNWITDRYHNYSVLDTETPYTGGDIGGNLKSGQKYYFSVTAIYTDAKIPGNSREFVYPTCGNPTPTTTTAKPTRTCTVKPTTICTTKPTATLTKEPPYAVPSVTGTVGNSTIRLDWGVIADSRLQGV